jgi:hypothetical protein
MVLTVPANVARFREWLRYFLSRNASRDLEYIATRLKQFGHITDQQLKPLIENRKFIAEDQKAFKSVHSKPYRDVEAKNKHLVSRAVIKAIDPAKSLEENMLTFMYTRLAGTATHEEHMDFLLDMGLLDYPEESHAEILLALDARRGATSGSISLASTGSGSMDPPEYARSMQVRIFYFRLRLGPSH